MDLKCIENKIQHRLTAPFTPKTNGMVERVNGTIKNNTILKTQYQSLTEMKNDLTNFLSFYNFNRRHGSIRKGLKVKTALNAIENMVSIKT
jgi:transposase InsO family protein